MNEKLSSLVGKPAKPSTTPDDKPKTSLPKLSQWAAFVPMAIALGFIVIAWMLFGERFIPAREVTVETVVTQRGGKTPATMNPSRDLAEDFFEGQALFQATGWIEPDPLPIRATALYSGIVDEVLVLEGESVSKGQILAKLIADDAKLDLETAEGTLARQEARLDGINAGLAIVRAKMQTLDKQVEQAQARGAELRDDADRLASIGIGGASEREIIQARLRVETQEAEIDALAISRKELEAQMEQLHSEREAQNKQIAIARTEVARKKLALSRTEIRSPVNGVVQHLMAAPGQKKMIMMDYPESATIAHLYEPDKLQARIDVPLEEAAKLLIGQPVRIRSSILPDRVFKGRVSRIVGQADLQRNTLQAKVRILESHPQLRPEMLCRAEFLPSSNTATTLERSTGGTGPVDVLVPLAALTRRAGNRAFVWMLDDDGKHLVKTEVALTDTVREGHMLVASGLKPGDKVVTHPPEDLTNGAKIRPIFAHEKK